MYITTLSSDYSSEVIGDYIVCTETKNKSKRTWNFLDGTYTDEYITSQSEIWIYQNKIRHRLDGPTVIRKIKVNDAEYKTIANYWYVDALYLQAFNSFITSKNKTNAIFRYIKKYPRNVNHVVKIARHNKWLNEDQLALLTCMDMFNPNL